MNNTARAAAHSFRLGWRDAWAQKTALTGTYVFFSVLIGLWASLWHMVDPSILTRAGLDWGRAVWYGAAGELVTFALALFYRDIEEDIRCGRMAIHLLRPVGFLVLAGSERMGHAALRLLLLGAGIAVLCFTITGTCPLGWGGMLLVAAMLYIGGFVWLLLQALVGLTSAWLPSARPVFMVVQKLAFVLGGMIVPVTLFPPLWRGVAWALPFPAIMYAGSSLFIRDDAAHVARMLAVQFAWIAILLLAVRLMQGACERRLIVKGD